MGDHGGAIGSGVRVRLLGGVGAFTGDGQPVEVGPPRCQALLAALALSPGTALSVARLVDLVWGADRPRTAERTLHSYVARLRRALGPAAITTVGAAYRLEVPADAVDALRFARLVETGDTAAALAQWVGAPLAGLRVTPGLAAIVDGLEERWLVAVETDLAGRIETDPAAALGRLAELTASHPDREELWALRMTALYRTGRQGDALGAYQTARRHLVERLGVEPGPRLRALEAMVLGQDSRLAVPAPVGGRPGNLPPRPGRLIGRDADLATVRLALSSWPVVTLVGPGGIGKTCLAVAAAGREEDADGAWLVDLVQAGSAADVPRAVAATLGVKESAGRDLTGSVVAALRPRRMLLVLDNCEHVLAGAAALAQAVADGCPRTRVLVTSRERLGLRGGHERVVPVGPLEPDGPGAELFRERAAALSVPRDPAGTDDAARAGPPGMARPDPVTEICRRLEGMPLAIELAAARTTTLRPADLLARLDNQLRLLVTVDGGQAGTGRHRAMRATIQWSYDLLTPPERTLLRRLAVFIGAFDLPAATAVAGDGPASAGTQPAGAQSFGSALAPGDAAAFDAGDVDEALAGLVARSMVVAEPGARRRRFRLLEPIRHFAVERLDQAGEADVLADRHAAWCADRVTEIHRLLLGRDEVAGVADLDELWPNLRSAFDWALRRADRRLAYALVRPLVTEIPRRNRGELGDWVERLLALTPAEDVEVVAFGLVWAGQRYKLAQDPAAFDRLLARQVSRTIPAEPVPAVVADSVAAEAGSVSAGGADAGGSAGGIVDVAVQHGLASVRQDFPALGLLTPSLIAWFRGRGDDDLAEHLELDVGASHVFGGRFAEGDATVGVLVERYRVAGPPTLLNMALLLLGYAALLQNRPARAEELLGAAVAVEVPARTHSPNRCVEARAYFRRGERARAYDILREHVDELLDSGNMQAICVTAVEFVNMMTTVDRLAEANRVLRHLDRVAPYWATLVADARQTIDAAGRRPPEPDLDDHEALEYIRAVLTELTPPARV
ncbi:BTAD domain-containing putative transcriptional regulator [Pseudofrankia inefficax]|uniref:BTAD domain-containing putative transcriptional regulator n=1 Tax=Pseudofrankia inefficax (strain DSM 45817 / CECT 9037 / DDB 130130 / EuI1c) TaxID=298654 RepID=UPI003F617F67